MSVGTQPTNAVLDNTITALAVDLRKVMERCNNLATQINSSNDGHGYLVSIGYSDTPNNKNPGGVSDAVYAQTLVAYFSQVAGVYYGTVQSGGTGGTGAINFNINSALSGTWNGQ